LTNLNPVNEHPGLVVTGAKINKHLLRRPAWMFKFPFVPDYVRR
jgi:hypothetical protein